MKLFSAICTVYNLEIVDFKVKYFWRNAFISSYFNTRHFLLNTVDRFMY